MKHIALNEAAKHLPDSTEAAINGEEIAKVYLPV